MHTTTRAASYNATNAWDALDIAEIDSVSVRLHWTDKPYQWHVNDGREVFAVLDGRVDMHVRENGNESIVPLTTGDVFYADEGCEHVAHPCGVARILVVERKGSV